MASNLVAKTSDNVQFVLFARVQTGLASWMSTVKAVSAGRPIDSTSQHHHPKTLYWYVNHCKSCLVRVFPNESSSLFLLPINSAPLHHPSSSATGARCDDRISGIGGEHRKRRRGLRAFKRKTWGKHGKLGGLTSNNKISEDVSDFQSLWLPNSLQSKWRCLEVWADPPDGF